MRDLAESDITTLKEINLSGGKQVIVSKGNKQEFQNSEWFAKDKQEPVDLFTSFIARNNNLEAIYLEYCDFSFDH